MLSIIICSKNGAVSEELKNNINETTACSYELIVIDNSKNEYSIFSAYNKGIEMSKYENLCFVHEDVKFLSPGWGNMVIQHLKLPNVGFVGVAGGRGMTQVPLGWGSYDSQINIYHFDLKNPKKISNTLTYNDASKLPVKVVALDGVFLCCKKQILHNIKFDESFKGFHGYDIDICLNAISKSYNNYVVYDIDILHFSHGKFDSVYINNLFKIYNKWSCLLPFYALNEISEKDLEKIERDNILLLRKKMIRAKMHRKLVYDTIRKYEDIIKYNHLRIKFEFIDYSFIKYTSLIRKKFVA